MTTAYNVNTQCPAWMSAESLAAFVAMLRGARTVDPAGLDRLVSRAVLLAWTGDAPAYRSIAGLKQPRASYLERVQALYRVRLAEDAIELGWLYTAPAHRHQGRARSMIRALLADRPNRQTYATGPADGPIHKALVSEGLRPRASAELNGRAMLLYTFGGR